MASRRKERRPYGLGSVFESPKGAGKWYARPPRRRGEPLPPKVQVADESAGDQLLARWRRDREDKLKSAAGWTVGKWLMHWLDTVVAEETPRSEEHYRRVVRLHVLPYPIADMALDEAAASDVRVWLAQLKRVKTPRGKVKKPLADETRRGVFMRLNAAFNVAVNDRLIRFNPCDGVKPPAPADDDERKGQALDAGQVGQLLEAIKGHWLFAFYFVALATGMRLGELIGLRWKNVVLTGDNPVIRVREQGRWKAKRATWGPPKSKASKRDIPLDEDTVAVLRQQFARLEERRRDPEAQWADHGLVFPSEVGTMLYGSSNILRNLRAVLKRIKLPESLRFHDLRHTAGSLMLAAGAQITDVSKILGHSSVAVTMKVYAHSYQDNQRKAVASVARQLRKAGGQ